MAGAQRSTALAAGTVPREACTHQACRPRGLSPTTAQAEQASLLDTQLGPTGTLQPLAEDPAFTMCSRAKTFCPCCNFASSAGRGCVMHSTAMRAMRAGDPDPEPQHEPDTEPDPDPEPEPEPEP